MVFVLVGSLRAVGLCHLVLIVVREVHDDLGHWLLNHQRENGVRPDSSGEVDWWVH